MKTGKAKAEAMDVYNNTSPFEKAISPSGKIHYIFPTHWKNGNVDPLCNHRQWTGDHWGQPWSIVDDAMAVTCGNCIRAFGKNQPGNKAVKGVVTAQKCNCCGHHEIGIITKDGKYIPLKPGTKVEIL